MPADIKTQPATKADSLQGTVFEIHNEAERIEAIDKAFDYRGDVTLTLPNETLECYIFNRDASAKPPRLEVFVKDEEAPRILPWIDVKAIAFTGRDTADGKKWADWVAKKESDRKAEAERIRQELEAQGHL
jgi:hypothetical protein